jgi:hypothetical protein
MAKVDDYQLSFDLAAKELESVPPSEVAARAGLEPPKEDGLYLSYYGRPLRVTLDPPEVIHLDEGPEIPLPEQALVMHYLARADGRPVTGEWITYREVESGEFYWSAFVKRAKAPLVGFFGHQPEKLLELAPKVGGRETDHSADVTVIVRAFPRVDLLLQLWRGDDEFPADGNILFDRSVGGYLSTEDIALTAGLPIYKMMAMARS